MGRSVGKALALMRRNPAGVPFADLLKVCEHYFGQPRRRGSHLFFTLPWLGLPLVNLQPRQGVAVGYQVRQVLAVIDKLEGERR